VDTLTRPVARRLRFITTAILIGGFGAAIAVYFVARARPANPLGYEPLETKQYLRDLEVYGGKANVLAAEFREWFAALWYGKQLAYTIAVITLLVVGAVRFVFAMRSASMKVNNAEDSPRAPRPD
jgi:hypothetical protein